MNDYKKPPLKKKNNYKKTASLTPTRNIKPNERPNITRASQLLKRFYCSFPPKDPTTRLLFPQ